MVVVEHSFCVRDVQVVHRVLFPRKLKDGLQVVQLHIIIGALRIDAFQFAQTLKEGFHSIFGHLLCRQSCTQLLRIFGGCRTSELVLYVLDFLLQEPLALLAVYLHLRLLDNAIPHVHKRLHLVDALYQFCRTLFHDGNVHQFLLVFLGYRKAGAKEVDHEYLIADVQDGKLCLVGQVLARLDEMNGTLATGISKHVELNIVLFGVEIHQLVDFRLQVRTRLHAFAKQSTARGL